MRKFLFQCLYIGIICSLANKLNAQIGYYDAPYIRYEADQGMITNASIMPKSYNQSSLQSEASEQACVNLSNNGAAVSWDVSAAGDGLVVRYSVPDNQSGMLEVYINNVYAGTLTLTSYYSWEYLWNNGNPNNAGVVNQNPKMRFDEVRMKLPSKIPAGGNLKLVRSSGNIYLDFAELESVPAAVSASAGNVIYGGNGSDLQNVIDANPGRTIYLPAGIYNVNRELYFGSDNTSLKGAGMWYTQIHFTNNNGNQGGLRANAFNISYSGLYLTTVRNSRSNSYKAINGVYTGGSSITNVWVEHFECGAWIGQYNMGAVSFANGFTVSHCRFRNNYADGINLCKGTRNTTVEHCSFRNNGDDDMAIWSAEGMECQSNTFRYNTSENCWRASGCAIYGGYNNKAHNLLIQDNLEVGIKVNNAFAGAGFNGGGMHEFYNITIKRCGTFNDLFNNPVGAIDIGSYDWGAGTRVQNVKFSCINIIDSKNDAIYIHKVTSGSDGFYNIIFENITVDGTGREYPNNNAAGINGARGYGLLLKGFPGGYATYCGMAYANRGGNATADINTADKGSFSWTQTGTCPGGCTITSSINITSASLFGMCNNPITLSAASNAPAGNTVNKVEFFVDNVSIGEDNSVPYETSWNNASAGTHIIKAVAYYSPSGITSTAIQNVTVAEGIYSTTSTPVIDGVEDAVWNNYAPLSLDIVSVGSISGTSDLTATFRLMRDTDYLYLFVDVIDDDLSNDGGNSYDNDGLELFIDMGNDKAGSYGVNDYAYSFLYNDPNAYEAQHNAVNGVSFKQGTRAGGYVMEIRIPWSTLDGAPGNGNFMGFDLHVNDDDGGGLRDAKKAWKDASDNAWQWPSVLGVLQIASCGITLPVDIISFTGNTINETAVLNWSTSSEIGHGKFIIERSVDLSNWDPIGEVLRESNGISGHNYTFIDYFPLHGNVYYRLLQEDSDGTIAYSSVIVIKTEPKVLTIIPYPFDDVLTIQSNVSGYMNIIISDMSGRYHYHLNQRIDNGSLQIHPDLPSGIYLITIQTETFSHYDKIIKR